MLKTIVLFAAASYLAIAAVVWFIQDTLVFFPQSASTRPIVPPAWTLQDVRLQAKDGTPLVGYLMRPPADKPPLLIYFGGNAEEATGAASSPERFGNRALLAFNYRGFGTSGDKPSEAAIMADAVEVFDWAARRPDIDAGRIALHGRSLGTAVALQVASQRPVKALVLTSPFESVRDLAKRIYPWLPVTILLRHPFDAGVLAPSTKAPALVLFGNSDATIPPDHSERLAARLGGAVERVSIANRGHNDLESDAQYFPAILRFLDKHL